MNRRRLDASNKSQIGSGLPIYIETNGYYDTDFGLVRLAPARSTLRHRVTFQPVAGVRPNFER